jgi:hypothetical protein
MGDMGVEVLIGSGIKGQVLSSLMIIQLQARNVFTIIPELIEIFLQDV